MTTSEMVTMREAADILGVSSVKMWQLVKTGVVAAHTNPLDRRQKLIRVADLDRLRTKSQDLARRRPRSIGMVPDLGVRSDEVEEYLKANWRPC